MAAKQGVKQNKRYPENSGYRLFLIHPLDMPRHMDINSVTGNAGVLNYVGTTEITGSDRLSGTR